MAAQTARPQLHGVWIAIVAALASSISNAWGALLQEQSARKAPPEESLKPRLLARLARRPRWLWGTGLVVLTFGLHGLALAFGPLALVQPVVLMRLPFAVPLSARQRRDRLHAREWLGLLLVTAGLVGFILTADPSGGHTDLSWSTWAWVGGAFALSVGACTLLARGPAGARRAVLLGGAAGLVFGAQGVMMKATTDLLHNGFVRMLASWQLWALVAVAVLGFLYQQSAYRAGSFAAARPPLDATQLVSSVLVGVLAFGEQVRPQAWAIVLEVASVFTALAGTWVLASSPLVKREEREQREQDRARSS